MPATKEATTRARPAMPSPTDSDDTPQRLRAVVSRLYRQVNASGRGTGLTPSQLTILGSVARSGPVRLSDLAESESVNPTMLSRIVAALDEAGLVRRSTDPDDRRAAHVEVTALGRRTHERLRAERARFLADGLAGLTPAQRRAVGDALPALEALVAAICR